MRYTCLCISSNLKPTHTQNLEDANLFDLMDLFSSVCFMRSCLPVRLKRLRKIDLRLGQVLAVVRAARYGSQTDSDLPQTSLPHLERVFNYLRGLILIRLVTESKFPRHQKIWLFFVEWSRTIGDSEKVSAWSEHCSQGGVYMILSQHNHHSCAGKTERGTNQRFCEHLHALHKPSNKAQIYPKPPNGASQ